MRWRLRRTVILASLMLAAVFLVQAIQTFMQALHQAQERTRCDGPAAYCNPALRGQKTEKTTLPPLNVQPTAPHCDTVARIEWDLQPLLAQIDSVREPWRWEPIKSRIRDNWVHWIQGAQELLGEDTSPRIAKQVLIVPGVLKATSFTDPEQIQKGAPAGDLQQWADLAAVLHVLGHNVTLMDDFYHAGRGLRYGWFEWKTRDGCVRTYERVFADIITMKTLLQDVLDNQKCKFHVVDAYGTEAMHNHPLHSRQSQYKSYYGGLGLDLKQFYTFFPHTVDNSFLGFAVAKEKTVSKEDIALLYGKDIAYFQGKEEYIKTIMARFEVHSTLANTTGLPTGIVNHGIISSQEYEDLLSRSKVLVGVGLPMESTGAVEGIAHGCIFLNAKYTGNQTRVLRRNDKPTSRKMTSQVPYLEEYIGAPHVHTVDIQDIQAVKDVLHKITQTKVQPLVPYEFSHVGMLDRMNSYLQNQDFCDTGRVWPDVNLTRPVIAPAGRSCTEHCKSQGLVCEIRHFVTIHKNFSEPEMNCGGHYVLADVTAPYVHNITGRCVHQGDPLLYSCSSCKDTVKRLCPCRQLLNSIDVQVHAAKPES